MSIGQIRHGQIERVISHRGSTSTVFPWESHELDWPCENLWSGVS